MGQVIWKIKNLSSLQFLTYGLELKLFFYLRKNVEVFKELFLLFQLKSLPFHFSTNESSSSSSENDSVSSLMNCRSSSSKRTRSKKGESSEGIVFEMDDSMMQFGDAYDSEVMLCLGILKIFLAFGLTF